MTTPAKPFLKWVGGKRQLLPDLVARMPESFDHYFEPFIGGGALFFEMCSLGLLKKPGRVHLSDVNPELINCYAHVRDHLDLVIDTLKLLKRDHANERSFYHLRANYPEQTNFAKAALFIYFNKTAFNGLMRQNKKGGFNMPWGYYEDPPILDEENLRACSLALQGVELNCQDFSVALGRAGADDFIYCDPPYVPVSKTASFTGYSKGGFGMDEQKKLCLAASLAVRREGAFVMLSNSKCSAVEALYSAWKLDAVSARRSVNSKGEKRGAVGEYIITPKAVTP